MFLLIIDVSSDYYQFFWLSKVLRIIEWIWKQILSVIWSFLNCSKFFQDFEHFVKGVQKLIISSRKIAKSKQHNEQLWEAPFVVLFTARPVSSSQTQESMPKIWFVTSSLTGQEIPMIIGAFAQPLTAGFLRRTNRSISNLLISHKLSFYQHQLFFCDPETTPGSINTFRSLHIGNNMRVS